MWDPEQQFINYYKVDFGNDKEKTWLVKDFDQSKHPQILVLIFHVLISGVNS
jgi:hypothetical protein